MEKFEFRNAIGGTVTFDYDGSFIIDSYDGLTSAEILPTTIQGYKQNGYKMTNISFGMRAINLNFYVYGTSMADLYEKRRMLATVFNPLLGYGVLTYTNDYISKSITCIPTITPTPTEKMGNLQIFNLELTAHNPFWYDTDETALKLEGFAGGMVFPLILASPGITLAEKASSVTIGITGDVPSPIRAEFKGVCVNPKLTLDTTGEYIKVATTMVAGQTLRITTDYGNKAVKLITGTTETNAFNLIDINTSFFSLPVGTNKITFTGDSGTPEVFLYWRNWYVGV